MQCIAGVKLGAGESAQGLRERHEVDGWNFLELVETHNHGTILLFSKPSGPVVSAIRNMTSGLAERTLKNLDFVKGAICKEAVHPVTQVINSLLSLLVFPVEQEKSFFGQFSNTHFPVPLCSHCGGPAPDHSDIETILTNKFYLSSLKVTKFRGCPNLSKFFKRLRNAISHKHLSFSSPDCKSLSDVIVTLKDKLPHESDFDWEISMTAEDLERIGRFVADEVVKLQL